MVVVGGGGWNDSLGDDSLVHWLWVSGVTGVGNLSLEAIVMVSGVMHSAGDAIGLHQRIFAFDDVTVAFLVLVLHVSGVTIMDTILESVMWVSL